MGRRFETTYQGILAGIIRGLETQGIPYMVVGGLAAVYHGIPRATFDIDLVLALDEQHLKPLVSLLRRLRFDLRADVAKQLLRISNCIPTMRPQGPRLDIWLIRSEYDRLAFSRRRRGLLWPAQEAWIASAEDTILSKLLAGRGRDFEDAIGVAEVQKGRLDWGYLTAWARRLGMTDRLASVKAKRV